MRQDLTPAAVRDRRPTVRVIAERGRVKCIWSLGGTRHYETRDDTPAARRELQAFCRGKFDQLTRGESDIPTLTIGQLWQRYEAGAFVGIRRTTQLRYAQRWRKFALFAGDHMLADQVSIDLLTQFRAALSKRHVVNQVAALIRVVKIVFNWAEQQELLTRNRVARYRFKIGKDELIHAPAEFQAGDLDKLLGALDGGQFGRSWKAWAAVAFAGSQGKRIRAILHLKWTDVDLEAGVIRWPAATDKTGRAQLQPLTDLGLSAILTARYWATERQSAHLAKDRRAVSDYLMPSASDPATPCSYQTVYAGLQRAATAANVPHLAYRGFHGLRKMVAGNIAAALDPWLALQFIGDTDAKRAKEYVKVRDERMDAAADAAVVG